MSLARGCSNFRRLCTHHSEKFSHTFAHKLLRHSLPICPSDDLGNGSGRHNRATRAPDGKCESRIQSASSLKARIDSCARKLEICSQPARRRFRSPGGRCAILASRRYLILNTSTSANPAGAVLSATMAVCAALGKLMRMADSRSFIGARPVP